MNQHCSYNTLTPNRRQAILKTNDSLVYWRKNASLTISFAVNDKTPCNNIDTEYLVDSQIFPCSKRLQILLMVLRSSCSEEREWWVDFDQILTALGSQVSNPRYVNNVSDNGLRPNRQQHDILTKNGIVFWRKYLSSGLNESKSLAI